MSVHWTDPPDRSQYYTPTASPFVSKLTTLAVRAHEAAPFDVLLSHYMEPYGIAGHLAAQITGVPHVTRMAGSDAGRLWHHPQLTDLYDHVLRSATVFITGGKVAARAQERGVDPARIAQSSGFVVPEELFKPVGPSLDLRALEAEIGPDLRRLLWGGFRYDRPYFGVCGKLGDNKGAFALLAALARLKRARLDVGLVVLGHGRPEIEQRFRDEARRLGVADRIRQLPFLPHWRVPAFLRSCLAVCCLEQDFPIEFHSPIIPREVLLCGTCLVASTEVLRKLPAPERLADGYNCVAIRDVNDIDELAGRLAAIVRDPAPAGAVGARGSAFARDLQKQLPFPRDLEHILTVAAKRRPLPTELRWMPAARRPDKADETADRFPLTRLVAKRLRRANGHSHGDATFTLTRARQVLAQLPGGSRNASLAAAVRTEIAIAGAENGIRRRSVGDSLFRWHNASWAFSRDAIADQVTRLRDDVRVLRFEFDVQALAKVRTAADFPAVLAPSRSHLAVAPDGHGGVSPFAIDAVTARILAASDGTRTAGAIADAVAGHQRRDILAWIERLFADGLIELRGKRPA